MHSLIRDLRIGVTWQNLGALTTARARECLQSSLSVLDLGPMYATDICQTSDAHHRLMPRRGNNNDRSLETVQNQICNTKTKTKTFFTVLRPVLS